MGKTNIITTDAIGVLIAAGGQGTRFGGGNKLLADFQGEAVFTRCLRNLNGPGIRFVVATHDRAVLSPAVPSGISLLWAPGGKTRTESVRNALQVLVDSPNPPEWVAVQDAARPLATNELLRQCLRLLRETRADGVIAAHPAVDTIHLAAEDGALQTTPPRERLWAAETPQLFRTELLQRAYAAWDMARPAPSDDAALVHAVFPESRILFCENHQDNRKITFRKDLCSASES